MVNRKNVILSVVFVTILGSSLSYGILIGRFKVFPYRYMRDIWFSAVESFGLGVASPVEKVVGSSEGKFSVETEWLDIEGRKYNIMGKNSLNGKGGGLIKVDNEILGVDGEGRFFKYDYGGTIEDLNMSIDMNYRKFVKHVESSEISNSAKRWFRVLDIYKQKNEKKVKIYVLHHFWKPKLNGKVVRLSVKSFEKDNLLKSEKLSGKSKWITLYESKQEISRGEPPSSPLVSNHTGGRVYKTGSEEVLISIGNYHMNGVHNEKGPVSQNDTSSYGKIISVNEKSRESDVFAKGVRNPQGLYVDDKGRIWETEHGPYGGDELNLIEEGRNYGWPYVTYGRSEGVEWPYKVRTHDEYVQPVYVFAPRTGISNLIEVDERPSHWDGDLLVSSLGGLKLFRVRIRDRRVIHVEPVRVGERIRDLVQTEEGSFILFADNARFLELWPENVAQPPSNTARETAE